VAAARTGTFYGQPMTAGDIYTIAGNGGGSSAGGFSGDGGPATSAELSQPGAMALGTHGSLLIADSGNERVRLVTG
jgi:serine/threonine-protein kinase